MARYYLSVKDKAINVDAIAELSTKLDNLKDLVFFTGSFSNEYELLLYLEERHLIRWEEFGHISYVMPLTGDKFKYLEEPPIYRDRLDYFDADNIKAILLHNMDNKDFIYYMLDEYVQREVENADSVIIQAINRLEKINKALESADTEEKKEDLERKKKSCLNQKNKYGPSQKKQARTYRDVFKSKYEQKIHVKTPEEIEMEKKLEEAKKLYETYKQRPPYLQPKKELGEIHNAIISYEIRLHKDREYEITERDIKEIVRGKIEELVDILTKENGRVNSRKLLHAQNSIRKYQNNNSLPLPALNHNQNIFNNLGEVLSTETLFDDDSFESFFDKLKYDDAETIEYFVSIFSDIAIKLLYEQEKHKESQEKKERTLDFIRALSGVAVFHNVWPSLIMLLQEYEDYFRIIFRRLDTDTINSYMKSAVVLH